jgi:hypothetical protein
MSQDSTARELFAKAAAGHQRIQSQALGYGAELARRRPVLRITGQTFRGSPLYLMPLSILSRILIALKV